MPKGPEDIDFSTPEGQKEFYNMSRAKRQEMLHYAEDLAEKLKGLVQIGVSKNYDDAQRKLESLSKNHFEPQMTFDFETGEAFLDTGAGPNPFGNIYEGAKKEVNDQFIIDDEIVQENLARLVVQANMLAKERLKSNPS